VDVLALMTRIIDGLGGAPRISVELWPPRSPQAAERLEASLDKLAELRPSFASITYGAAGSTRERTHDLVVEMEGRRATTAMAHLTCVAHSRAELVGILRRYRDAGVENVLALRGDRPAGGSTAHVEGELEHAVDLVELASTVGRFCIAVAAHPAGHPEAPDVATDRRHLAEKLRIADFAITQFFYAPEEYLALRDDLAALGVDKPVVPGVMPVTSARTLERMASLSGNPVPEWLRDRIARAGSDAQLIRRAGVEVATQLCSRLLECGAPGLHFYTMNDVEATLEVASALGLVPAGDIGVERRLPESSH